MASKDTVHDKKMIKNMNAGGASRNKSATHRLHDVVELAAHVVLLLPVVEVHLWLGKNMIRVI